MWLNLWESNTGRQILSTKDDAYIVFGCAFSPDGKRLVGTGGDEVRIWDTDTGELVLTLKGYRNELCFATFSPDGSRVITSSLNGVEGTMKVWDAQNGREMLMLNGLTASQFVGGFSRDGRRLLTQAADGTLRILEAFDWNITPEELEQQQRPRYKRWLQQNGETVEAKDDSIHSLSPGRVAAALQSASEASRRKTSREPCRNNLKLIAVAEALWAADHDGRFSEKLSELYPTYAASPQHFWCPSAGISKITDERLIDSQTNYVLRRGLSRASPPTEVLIYENPANHGAEGGHVVQVDGTVRWADTSELRAIAERDRQQAEGEKRPPMPSPPPQVPVIPGPRR